MCLTQFQKKINKWKNWGVFVCGGWGGDVAVFFIYSSFYSYPKYKWYRKKHLYACVHCALPRTPCNANYSSLCLRYESQQKESLQSSFKLWRSLFKIPLSCQFMSIPLCFIWLFDPFHKIKKCSCFKKEWSCIRLTNIGKK